MEPALFLQRGKDLGANHAIRKSEDLWRAGGPLRQHRGARESGEGHFRKPTWVRRWERSIQALILTRPKVLRNPHSIITEIGFRTNQYSGEANKRSPQLLHDQASIQKRWR